MKRSTRFFLAHVLLPFALILLIGGCKTTPPVASDRTPPTVSITSPSHYDVVKGTCTITIEASDNERVTKVELYVGGSLASTDETSPYEFSWDTEQWDDGTYTMYAKAYDGAGNVGQSSSISVIVSNAFPATFINTVFTPITITVSGVTRTIQPDDSTVFVFSTTPGSFSFTASTSGKTNQGTQIGRLMQWAATIDCSSREYYRARLIINSSYWFMYMTNNSATSWTSVYVNYGLSDQTVDYITIPGNGSTYSTGYYKAYTNTIVRAYYSGGYISWSGLPFPWTENQWFNLTYTPSGQVLPGPVEGGLSNLRILRENVGIARAIPDLKPDPDAEALPARAVE